MSSNKVLIREDTHNMERDNTTSSMPVDAVLVAEIELSPMDMLALQEEAEKVNRERETILGNLAGDVEAKWMRLSANRQTKEEEWRKATRLRLGNLSAERGNKSKTFNAEPTATRTRPDHNLVKEKCKIAIAQLISQQFSGGDKNWDIKPSPRPEQDPGQAASSAKALEREIDDQLTATKYGHKARKAIEDRVNLGTGILKGPVPSIQKKRVYDEVQGPDGNMVAIPRFESVSRPEVYRVDPWMFYPDDSVSKICDAEYAIEIHPMNKTQLAKLAKAEGFFDDVILELLRQGPSEYNETYFNDVTALTDSGENYLRNKYAVLEYHGPISIEQATTLGLEPSYESLDDTFIGEVWVCMGRVIRASLEAIDGAYELPYMASTWLDDPNSPFGFSLPIEMEDSQRIHTSTLHMLLDNAAVSGGPQVVINREYIKPVNGAWEIQPHKIWESTDSTLQSIDQAFKAFVVPNVSGSLSPLLDMAQQWAMQESGINAIAAGMNSPQAGTDSATGLAILQQQATVVTDMLAEDWDDNITQKLIERMYHWNIQYNLRPEFVGFDFEVDVRSSTELRNKQMQVNNLEKLSIEAGQNPMLGDWVNQEKLTEARLAMMRLPNVGIVRTPEEYAQIQEQKAQQEQPPDPNMVKLEIENSRVQMEMQRLAFEREKFQFESTKQLEQLRLEEMVQLEQIEARKFDAQARVTQAQLEYDRALAELAMRDEHHQMDIYADLQKSQATINANKFLEGMRQNAQAQDRMLTVQEMRLKAATGSGI
jgi:hypothetical protein